MWKLIDKMGFRMKLREHAHLHYLYQKIAAIENGKGGTQPSAPEIGACIAPFGPVVP